MLLKCGADGTYENYNGYSITDEYFAEKKIIDIIQKESFLNQFACLLTLNQNLIELSSFRYGFRIRMKKKIQKIHQYYSKPSRNY
jgi:uncharacterized membrane protein